MYEIDNVEGGGGGGQQTADGRQQQILAERLHANGWTPLKALVMLLFVMLYSPCLATYIVIWRETGHIKYMLIAILYTNVLAFCLAVGVYQVGRLIG